MSAPADLQTVMRDAVELHRQGRLDPALALYARALAAEPRNADILRLAGMAACQAGRLTEGAGFLERSLEVRANQPDVHYNLGLALQSLGRLETAIASYDRALSLQPAHAEAWLNRGNGLMDLDRLAEALVSYDRALTIVPGLVEALINRSDVLMNMRRPAEALPSYDRVVEAEPGLAYAWSNRGTALIDLERYAEALDSYDRALSLDPDLADAHTNRGNALKHLGRHDEAVAACEAALKLHPGFARAFNIRGNAEMALRRFEDALKSYDRALALQPGYAEALGNRGGALMNLKRFAEAIASCDEALALLPDVPETHNNRGSALLGLERFAEALVEFDHAVRLAPRMAEAHSNRGNALQGLERLAEAVVCYDNAIAIDPAYAQAWSNRGNALQRLERLEEAVVSYRWALDLKPDMPWVPGQLLHYRMQMADWEGFEDAVADLDRRIRNGETPATPFMLHSMVDAPDLHRRAAHDFLTERYLPRDGAPLAAPPAHDRIRLAYVSSDFGDHPVTHLMAGVLEHHDRARFEVYAISTKKEADAGWRGRVVAAVDHFIDVSGKTDAEVTALMRELEIDIAVDLNGYTQDCRTLIFAARAAPVQVNYIGFLGTMAADYIDYAIADPVVLPLEAAEADYAEKIVHLPVFQVNDDRPAEALPIPSRREAGLPENGFVFCCFNMVYKITPDVFEGWMRILTRVPGSVLWLYAKSEIARANLKAGANKHGVAPDRIVFAGRVPPAEHLARQKCADLFLDTHPYNAGATASNALKAGLPVLTRIGRSYAARMGASLLTTAGTPDLITETPQDYEDMAVALAADPAKLARTREKLALGVATGPLFDTRRATRDLESAYTIMHQRYRDGLPPDHIPTT